MTTMKTKRNLGAQLESIRAAVPESIGRILSHPTEALGKVVPGKGTLVSAIAITAASLGGLMIGSMIHRHSAWTGLNATAGALPRFRARRPSSSFDVRRALTAGAALAVGSFALAMFEGTIGQKVGRIGRGALGGVTALAMDRVLGSGAFWRGLKRALGTEGLAITYGAIGAACALSPKQMNGVQHDPSGGDIAAGVPAMG